MISIIIPVYNASEYLEACLNSALSQQADLEIVTVDDGSTDNSLHILNDFARKDTRVRVFSQQNAGPSAARNKAMDNAQGELLMFLDADDTLVPGCLSQLTQLQKAQSADLVIGRFEKRDLQGEVVTGHVNATEGLLTARQRGLLALDYLKAPNQHLTFAYAWGRLFKRELIEKHGIRLDEALHSYEDVVFNYDYLARCDTVVVSDVPTYRFLVRTDHSSLTFEFGNDPSRLLGYNHALSRIADYISAVAPDIDFRSDLANAVVSLTVIQGIRIGVNLNTDNFGVIYQTFANMLKEPLLQDSLNGYVAQSGHSQLIPFLMKRQWTLPTLLACASRGRKRYGTKS